MPKRPKLGGPPQQLRVEYDASYMGPASDEPPVMLPPRTTALQGKIFYEGGLPKGHFVFFAPLATGKYHVLVFEAEPVPGP